MTNGRVDSLSGRVLEGDDQESVVRNRKCRLLDAPGHYEYRLEYRISCSRADIFLPRQRTIVERECFQQSGESCQ